MCSHDRGCGNARAPRQASCPDPSLRAQRLLLVTPCVPWLLLSLNDTPCQAHPRLTALAVCMNLCVYSGVSSSSSEGDSESGSDDDSEANSDIEMLPDEGPTLDPAEWGVGALAVNPDEVIPDGEASGERRVLQHSSTAPCLALWILSLPSAGCPELGSLLLGTCSSTLLSAFLSTGRKSTGSVGDHQHETGHVGTRCKPPATVPTITRQSFIASSRHGLGVLACVRCEPRALLTTLASVPATFLHCRVRPPSLRPCRRAGGWQLWILHGTTSVPWTSWRPCPPSSLGGGQCSPSPFTLVTMDWSAWQQRQCLAHR